MNGSELQPIGKCPGKVPAHRYIRVLINHLLSLVDGDQKAVLLPGPAVQLPRLRNPQPEIGNIFLQSLITVIRQLFSRLLAEQTALHQPVSPHAEKHVQQGADGERRGGGAEKLHVQSGKKRYSTQSGTPFPTHLPHKTDFSDRSPASCGDCGYVPSPCWWRCRKMALPTRSRKYFRW